jgi:hypothetical protein
VLTNFDIFVAAGGKNIAISRVFTNTVADSQLEIQFFSIIDNARASGIQVRKIADLDSDGDGIPDWWMLAYFDHPTGQDADSSLANEDADGDGQSNLMEFLSGTDPTDASSLFEITNIQVFGANLQITWTTQPSRKYQLQSADSPEHSGSWIDVGSLTLGTGGVVTQTVASPQSQFFRVRLAP